MTLSHAFLDRPIAHRAYHDADAGRPENSRAAIRAAIAAGYGIEIDLQLARDGVPLVFHDYHLSRLTPENGPLALRTAEELTAVPLRGSDETIPTLAEILDLVAGRVPLLIEIKDQDGAMGPRVGRLERAAAKVLHGYCGPAALMSFNPHSVAALARVAPDRPRGFVTCGFAAQDWPHLPPATRDALRDIPDYDRTRACFVSHEARDLDNPRLTDLRAKGAHILCWTIRSPQEAAAVRGRADNITFEGYPA